MPTITIVADIRANSDQVEFVRAELQKLVPITRAEEGCIQYDLHQDNDDPAHFLFYETWESRELWRVHSNASHVAAFAAATNGAIADFQLHEMTRLD